MARVPAHRWARSVLQVLAQEQACSSVATACVHAAVDDAPSTSGRDFTQVSSTWRQQVRWQHSATAQHAQPSSMSTSTSSAAVQQAESDEDLEEIQLPASVDGSYVVQIAIKGFEPRYVNAASATIRDIMLIHVSPKSTSTLPRKESVTNPVNIFLPIHQRRVKINWRKTRFTVIRGPHIDKPGMEQFEMRSYKTVLRVPTHSATEVQWLLDSLCLYEFPGVELQVQLTSSTYLQPSPLPAKPSIGKQSILAQHRTKIAPYLMPAAPSAEQQAEEEMRQALQSLRSVVFAGLENRRTATPEEWKKTHPNASAEDAAEFTKWRNAFSQWHTTAKLSSPLVTAPKPEVELRSGAAASEVLPPLSQLSSEQARSAAAFLAAVDATLLSVKLDGADPVDNFKYHIGAYQVGKTKEDAAFWMQAVLKYAEYASLLRDVTQGQALVKAYSSYSLFAHTLLYTMLKVWFQQTVAEFKPHLALPAAAQLEGVPAGSSPAAAPAAAPAAPAAPAAAGQAAARPQGGQQHQQQQRPRQGLFTKQQPK